MPSSRTRQHRRRVALTAIASFFLTASALLAVLAAVAPESVERVYGYLRHTTQTVEHAMSTELPHVRLGDEGGTNLLDECDGSFSEMLSYRSADTIPVYAAHNNCGGDIIHPWNIGQQVRVEGRTAIYQVVDIRDVPKREGTTNDITNLQGEFSLQTCYYGVNQMKFVGLAPIPAT
jgi:hypothetical protein